MSFFYTLFGVFENNKRNLDDLKNKNVLNLEKKKSIEKELEVLKKSESRESEKIKMLTSEKDALDVIMKIDDLKTDELRKIIENTQVIEVINVGRDNKYQLLNGLIDLNRDILMKILKIIKDEEKTRIVIGMAKIFYMWSKQEIFRFARYPANLSLRVRCHPDEKEYVNINSDRIHFQSFRRKMDFSICFVLDKEMKRGIFNFVFESEGESPRYCGLVLKTMLSSFRNFERTKDTCGIFCTGIECDGETVHAETGLIKSEGKCRIMLELELGSINTGSLRFFADGCEIPHVVTHIPQSVYFFFGMSRTFNVTLISFQQLGERTPHKGKELKRHKWNDGN